MVRLRSAWWIDEAEDDGMQITRNGSRPSEVGPTEYFVGTVRVDRLFEAPAPARVVGASVTFEPGARTAWHTHPLGQTLIVVSGLGLAQREGGAVEDVAAVGGEVELADSACGERAADHAAAVESDVARGERAAREAEAAAHQVEHAGRERAAVQVI